MSDHVEKTIQEFEKELESLSRRSTEIKKTINQLLFLRGSAPRYTDVETDGTANQSEPEPRQFVGKNMESAVKEFLKMKGKAATAQEILNALLKGDFSFPRDWKRKLYLKNLAIFLGSRKDDFVWFETNDGKVYGSVDVYPERKRELDRMQKINAADSGEVETENPKQ